jgi:hypothetical protein
MHACRNGHKANTKQMNQLDGKSAGSASNSHYEHRNINIKFLQVGVCKLNKHNNVIAKQSILKTVTKPLKNVKQKVKLLLL